MLESSGMHMSKIKRELSLNALDDTSDFFLLQHNYPYSCFCACLWYILVGLYEPIWLNHALKSVAKVRGEKFPFKTCASYKSALMLLFEQNWKNKCEPKCSLSHVGHITFDLANFCHSRCVKETEPSCSLWSTPDTNYSTHNFEFSNKIKLAMPLCQREHFWFILIAIVKMSFGCSLCRLTRERSFLSNANKVILLACNFEPCRIDEMK